MLLLTDTPPDPSIEGWAAQRKVKVLFGADNLVDRLLALADGTGVTYPPTAGHILNEVDAVTGGLIVPAGVGPAPEPVEEAAQDLIARQVLIHHVNTVNVYVSQAYSDGRDRPVLPVR